MEGFLEFFMANRGMIYMVILSVFLGIEVISHVPAVSCIQLPTFETTAEAQQLRKTGWRSVPQADGFSLSVAVVKGHLNGDDSRKPERKTSALVTC